MLVLSRLEYSELALECRQKVKSKNYFAQVSNSTTKFLSVYIVAFGVGLKCPRKIHLNTQCKKKDKIIKDIIKTYIDISNAQKFELLFNLVIKPLVCADF